MSNTKDGMTYTHGFSRGWWVKIWLNKLCIGSITGVCKDDAESIAKEICRRWNSQQPDLLEASENLKVEYCDCGSCTICKLQAAIAKAKKE